MTVTLEAMSFAAAEPSALARFWRELVGRTEGFELRFVAEDAPRDGLNRAHLHLTSAADGDQQRTVDRALALGAHHLDVGQLPDESHIVLADPEGNEFCVIEAGNRYLADTAFLGELAWDGSHDVGLFWSAALDWPLVWDQDGETAVQSPAGGAKISWGGPPVRPKTAPNRVHLDLAGDIDDVDRLVGLGATRRAGNGCGGAVALADPDGNEFCLLTR